MPDGVRGSSGGDGALASASRADATRPVAFRARSPLSPRCVPAGAVCGRRLPPRARSIAGGAGTSRASRPPRARDAFGTRYEPSRDEGTSLSVGQLKGDAIKY
eukprot:31306-Pelagococcus_subviridis.AAC.1